MNALSQEEIRKMCLVSPSSSLAMQRHLSQNPVSAVTLKSLRDESSCDHFVLFKDLCNSKELSKWGTFGDGLCY